MSLHAAQSALTSGTKGQLTSYYAIRQKFLTYKDAGLPKLLDSWTFRAWTILKVEQGTRVYEISDNLAVRLAHTELSGVSIMSGLLLPAPMVVLQPPVSAGLPVYYDSRITHVAACDATSLWPEDGHGRMVFGMYGAFGQEHAVVAVDLCQKYDEVFRTSGDWKNHPAWQAAIAFYINAIMYTTLNTAEVQMVASPELKATTAEYRRTPVGTNRKEHLEKKLETLMLHQEVTLGQHVPPLVQPQNTDGILYARVTGHWRKQSWIEPHWRKCRKEEL
jgi:hypothetical protein